MPLGTTNLDPVVVDLVNTNSPNTVLASVTLNNANSWSASFGHFNEFTEAGVKINYGIKEHAIAGYVSTTVFDEENDSFTLLNKQVPGGVILNKTKENNQPLENAEFELYTADNTLIGTYMTSDQGQIVVDNLVVGAYYFKEKIAPLGYHLNSTNVQFTIDLNQTTATVVNVVNEAVYDKVIITKDLVDTADLALRDTFSFTVEGHDSDNVLQFTQTVSVTANTKTTTGWMGSLEIDQLLVGSYYFVERTAPVGYQLNTDKQHFEIKIGQKEAVSLTVVNIEIPEDSKPPVRGTENPNTGQSNDTQYYLYLMAIGAFLLLILRKKKTVNVIKELNK